MLVYDRRKGGRKEGKEGRVKLLAHTCRFPGECSKWHNTLFSRANGKWVKNTIWHHML